MVKTYTISEFLQEDHHYGFQEFLIDVHSYVKLQHAAVVLIALLLHVAPVYAGSFETNLSESAGQIIDLLLLLAQYSFLGLGLKEIIAVVIAGGTFKEAASAGIQYLLTYMLIKLYPSLFDMFSDIKF